MDDAGVYRISPDLALVQTVDFFFPIVNDPRMNGRISAANSLSDVWAMGAQAHTAMNVLAYPPGLIPAEVIGEMLAGGSEKLVEAKVALVGGHTMEQENLLYGMSVTGTVHPDEIRTNTGAKVGDAVILTKALGSGVYGNAMMKSDLTPGQYRTATDAMSRLNLYASRVLGGFRVSAMTDVTGFGLLGHTLPIARSSGVTIELMAKSVPFLPDMDHLQQEFGAKGVCKVEEYVTEYLQVLDGVSQARLKLLSAAETSGGLLACIHPDDAEQALNRLREAGDEAAALIGRVGPLQEEDLFLRVV